MPVIVGKSRGGRA
jgi:obg-like ATPase 1